jgi:FHS family glucose/mannose:H+ symporter-like MFS transporter
VKRQFQDCLNRSQSHRQKHRREAAEIKIGEFSKLQMSHPIRKGINRNMNRQSPSSSFSGWMSTVIVYLAFAATGIGMALPGSVLPALLVRLSLADSQAGLLFFLGWLGSSLGALLVHRSRTRSVAYGSALIALGAFGMAYGVDRFRWACFGWMAIFGLGLGTTMTSINLLQAGRHFERRGAELNRLNLVWSIGACACPTLAAHSLQVTDVRTIFTVVAAFFALVGLWATTVERHLVTTAIPAGERGGNWSFRRIRNLSLWPLSLVIVIFLPTGIESSMGGWIAAYVQRTQQTITTTVTAGTCFWVGLMLSRLLSSTVLLIRRSERLVLTQSLCTVVLGTLLLISSTVSLGILPGVFLIGFGLGPVYPMLLAIALQYSENTLIFFVAGLGSAFLPWLTGILSSATSSLRLGLLVPFVASVLMLGLGLRQIVAGAGDRSLRPQR